MSVFKHLFSYILPHGVGIQSNIRHWFLRLRARQTVAVPLRATLDYDVMTFVAERQKVATHDFLGALARSEGLAHVWFLDEADALLFKQEFAKYDLSTAADYVPQTGKPIDKPVAF